MAQQNDAQPKKSKEDIKRALDVNNIALGKLTDKDFDDYAEAPDKIAELTSQSDDLDKRLKKIQKMLETVNATLKDKPSDQESLTRKKELEDKMIPELVAQIKAIEENIKAINDKSAYIKKLLEENDNLNKELFSSSNSQTQQSNSNTTNATNTTDSSPSVPQAEIFTATKPTPKPSGWSSSGSKWSEKGVLDNLKHPRAQSVIQKLLQDAKFEQKIVKSNDGTEKLVFTSQEKDKGGFEIENNTAKATAPITPESIKLMAAVYSKGYKGGDLEVTSSSPEVKALLEKELAQNLKKDQPDLNIKINGKDINALIQPTPSPTVVVQPASAPKTPAPQPPKDGEVQRGGLRN